MDWHRNIWCFSGKISEFYKASSKFFQSTDILLLIFTNRWWTVGASISTKAEIGIGRSVGDGSMRRVGHILGVVVGRLLGDFDGFWVRVGMYVGVDDGLGVGFALRDGFTDGCIGESEGTDVGLDEGYDDGLDEG